MVSKSEVTKMPFRIHSDQAGMADCMDGSRGAGEGHIVPSLRDDEEVLRLASIGFMTRGLAHDMANLLQVTASALHMIDRTVDYAPDHQVRRLTQAATESLERGIAMSRRLFDRSNASPRPAEALCPNAIIAAVGDLVALTVGPDIELRILCSSDLPAVVCNPHEFENVIFNLVLNARDAMPEGGVLTLSTYREDSGGDEYSDPLTVAVVSVRDSGCGIPAEMAGKVFLPFYSTKPQGRGTGLGLAMVNDFVQRCGGSAELQSAVGKGTVIKLRLPGLRAT